MASAWAAKDGRSCGEGGCLAVSEAAPRMPGGARMLLPVCALGSLVLGVECETSRRALRSGLGEAEGRSGGMLPTERR